MSFLGWQKLASPWGSLFRECYETHSQWKSYSWFMLPLVQCWQPMPTTWRFLTRESVITFTKVLWMVYDRYAGATSILPPEDVLCEILLTYWKMCWVRSLKNWMLKKGHETALYWDDRNSVYVQQGRENWRLEIAVQEMLPYFVII